MELCLYIHTYSSQPGQTGEVVEALIQCLEAVTVCMGRDSLKMIPLQDKLAFQGHTMLTVNGVALPSSEMVCNLGAGSCD